MLILNLDVDLALPELKNMLSKLLNLVMEHFKGYEWFPQYIRGHIHSDETLF
jgi:hypothetical protein